MKYLSALFYESLLAEEHLKEIWIKYGDKMAEVTLRAIKYSKYTMLFSLLILLFGVGLNFSAEILI